MHAAVNKEASHSLTYFHTCRYVAEYKLAVEDITQGNAGIAELPHAGTHAVLMCSSNEHTDLKLCRTLTP